MKSVSVYVATCSVTGKKYVGITKQLVRERRSRHWQESRKGSPGPFYAAIRKYGKQAFSFEHVACCKTWEDACSVEILLVSEYRTISPDGYNLSPGGQGDPKGMTPEQKAAAAAGVRAYWAGRSMPEETKAAISKAKIGHTFSRDNREAIASATKTAMANPEIREKISAGVRAARQRDSSRMICISEIVKRPEVAAKLKTVNVGRKWSKEALANRAAGIKRAWALKRGDFHGGTQQA